MAIVGMINDFLWSYVLIFVLIASGIYFTIKLKFANFTQIKEMFKIMLDKGDGEGISPFQAFCISAASKVGTGSIVGVVIAISTGGPGAVFWMWVLTFIAASLSLVENTLAQIYKIKDKDIFVGGPAYYMEFGLNKKYLGIFFSILITVTYGFIFNAVQSNTITSTIVLSLKQTYEITPLSCAIALTLLTGIIIAGGTHFIAKISEIFMPIIGVLYLGVALYVICRNIDQFFSVFHLIIGNAINPEAIGGGALGTIILQGIKRGLFSNEAGMGSTPNAAATASTSHPFNQGLVQTLGAYITTLGVCSATAFIVLFSGVLGTPVEEHIELMQLAMKSQLGTFGQAFLVICIFLFAYSSIIGNYFYGIINIAYIKKPWAKLPFQCFVLFMIFWGAINKSQLVWDLADVFMALMALVNIYALFLLRNTASECVRDYLEQRKTNKHPVFKKSVLSDSKGIQNWN